MNSSGGLAYNIQEGREKPLVFIHGWLGSRNFWKLITPYLKLENKMIFYDQRCHGDSDCSKFDVDSLADDLHNLIKELELKEPVLIGHSLGGMTALRYATKYDNFSGLCLLGTSASTPNPENKSVKYFLDKFDDLSRDKWAEKIVDNYVSKTESKEVRELTRKELKQADESPIRYGLEAMINYDVRDNLKQLNITAKVIAAEHDGAITVQKSRELKDLLNCELETVDTSHQMLPERPKRIAETISNFVNNELN